MLEVRDLANLVSCSHTCKKLISSANQPNTMAFKLSNLMAKRFRGECHSLITTTILKNRWDQKQITVVIDFINQNPGLSFFKLYRSLGICINTAMTPPSTPKTGLSPLTSLTPDTDLVRAVRLHSKEHSLTIHRKVQLCKKEFPDLNAALFTSTYQLFKAASKAPKRPFTQLQPIAAARLRLGQRRSPPSSAAPSPRHGASNQSPDKRFESH